MHERIINTALKNNSHTNNKGDFKGLGDSPMINNMGPWDD